MTPDTIIISVITCKHLPGWNDWLVVLSNVDGVEVEQFGKMADARDWLNDHGYVCFDVSRKTWVKAPKVPSMKENAR